MTDGLSPLLQWLNTHPDLAGLATFCISAAESIAIIGTIIPGTVMMTGVGALAGAGVMPLYSTILWAILGAIAGDSVSYWLGRYFNTRLRYIWPFRQHPELLQSGERFFLKHGAKSVFIGRFVGPVRALVPLVAGMMGVKPLRFTIANVASAIGWAPAYMLPGILLGAAALELPSDLTMHFILTVFLSGLFIILCIWVIKTLLALISGQINRTLTHVWQRLQNAPYFHLITTALKHHDPKKTHGQLTLACYFFLTATAFCYLAYFILTQGPSSFAINHFFFFLFRSLRTPTGDQIMLWITLLGEKNVLLPLMVVMVGYFAWIKRWHTAWHVLALSVLVMFGLETSKLLIHSPRPWGILGNGHHGYSFPSGHTGLATAIYFGLALLLIKSFNIQRRWIVYGPVLLLVLAISTSRLYFGAHWFTDILGGWIISTAILMLITLSYNRHTEKKWYAPPMLAIFFVTLSLSHGFYLYHSGAKLKRDYTTIEWPTYTLTLESWWHQEGDHLPLYRVNRFGLSTEVFNLQWVGHLNEIKQTLIRNGWEVPPPHDWASILYRISNVKSADHLPLVSPLYLDKEPVLVLIKRTSGDKKLMAIRFWNSYTTFSDDKEPLWVGTVEFAPSTYSWIFKRKKNNEVDLTPAFLFTNTPGLYDMQQVTITTHDKHRRVKEKTMLLIKQRG